MSPLGKAILVNLSIAVALLACLFFYPAFAVAITATFMFPIANILMFIKARKDREKGNME